MIVKSKDNNKALLAEGNYASSVGSVKGKPNDTEPKKIDFGYRIENQELEVHKEVPVSFENGTSLRKDVETLLGRELTTCEANEGIDLNDLIGKACQVIVVHRSGAGGKPVAVVGIVLPVPQTTAQPVTN